MPKKHQQRENKTAAEPEKPRTRKEKSYPNGTFAEVLVLGQAILQIAGEKVRRLTLLEKLNRSPTSGPTRALITASGKYGITRGSYAADYLELTADGKKACDESHVLSERLASKFALAIANVPPFKALYDEYAGKRLPASEVMKDFLDTTGFDVVDHKECIDIFIVNAKDIGLLRLIAGAETLVRVEQVIEEAQQAQQHKAGSTAPAASRIVIGPPAPCTTSESIDYWNSTCFYMTPIGDEGSEARRHADLIMSSIVMPAVLEVGLTVVRADNIGEPGMITSQILEHIKRSKLVIADLSFLNPNVFYEMALRHACRLPIVQLIRKADRLPFDINQVRTVVIDMTDIYTLVPRITTYIAEVAAQARKALEDPEHAGNPISVFYPAYW